VQIDSALSASALIKLVVATRHHQSRIEGGFRSSSVAPWIRSRRIGNDSAGSSISRARHPDVPTWISVSIVLLYPAGGETFARAAAS